MKEAWLIKYTDPISNTSQVELVEEEPISYYYNDPDYYVMHIAYIELE